MGILDTLFGGKKKSEELSRMIQNGAAVIDVRSQSEFASGHVQGSLNIPLGQIPHKIAKLKKLKKPIVACCASGTRSAAAVKQLNTHGLQAYNGGSWNRVQKIIALN